MRKNSEAPRIVIAGYYGLGNAGDEAILSGMVRDLRAEVPGADLRVLSLNPDRVHALHGIRAESLRDLPGIIEAIRESDLVILGGGGLLHDYWPLDESQLLTPAHQGLALYLGVPLLAEMLGRPYMLYGLGVGPIRHATSIPLMKTVLDGAERITVRDEISREAIQAVMGEGVDIRHRVEVTADPAFNMRWELASEGTSRKAPMIGKSGPRLGVNLRFWDFGVNPGDWEREVARGLDRWIGEQGGEVLFIPLQDEGGHRYENDRAICERVRSEMRDPSRAIMLDPGNAFHNLPGILSQCDVVMSMRMHGILFSLLVGVAGLGLAYDPKVEALLARMGMNEYARSVEGRCHRGETHGFALPGCEPEDRYIRATDANEGQRKRSNSLEANMQGERATENARSWHPADRLAKGPSNAGAAEGTRGQDAAGESSAVRD